MQLEALTSSTKKLWPKLKEFREFVFAGGTALAVQIGHRISVDFDFFSEKEIPRSLLKKVEKIFGDSQVKVLLNNLDQLTVSIGGVNLTFVTYRFFTILPLVEFQGVRLLSVKEIAATKAYVLGRRSEYKDYVDLYFVMAEEHTTLEEICELAQKKYGNEFNKRLFLEQLIYLEDVSESPITFLKGKVTKAEIESFFEDPVKRMPLP